MAKFVGRELRNAGRCDNNAADLRHRLSNLMCHEPLSHWYRLSHRTVTASILIYAFADIRNLCRNRVLNFGDPDAVDRIMNLPASTDDVITVFNDNRDTLKYNFGDEGVDFYLSAMANIQDNLRRHAVDEETGEASYHSSRVVVFNDDKSNDELVYGIAVNTARKRITVAFRGSVTVKDFMIDAKALQTDIANPLVGSEINQSSTIGIHHGFYDYLFAKNARRSEPTKCDEVVAHVLRLYDFYPGYRLYVTGHSLGGALATLFAFQVAASTDPRIVKPVTCISIASPKVGTMSFRRAFQALEKSRQIRCLRVSNHKDLVTLLPDRGSLSCAYILCCQSNVFRHVGMELKLHGHGYQFLRPSDNSTYVHMFLKDWATQVKNTFYIILTLPLICCKEDFLRYHGCKEYMERLTKHASGLQSLYLNNLYRDKEVLETTE
jgi:hypothetical protein